MVYSAISYLLLLLKVLWLVFRIDLFFARFEFRIFRQTSQLAWKNTSELKFKNILGQHKMTTKNLSVNVLIQFFTWRNNSHPTIALSIVIKGTKLRNKPYFNTYGKLFNVLLLFTVLLIFTTEKSILYGCLKNHIAHWSLFSHFTFSFRIFSKQNQGIQGYRLLTSGNDALNSLNCNYSAILATLQITCYALGV
jgi:hypothetical protein